MKFTSNMYLSLITLRLCNIYIRILVYDSGKN